uniref:Uncharacterized protein n=1 Tax=Anguilla anguilla TaxID=7936 RepID=A0A0E9X1I2_ANGAN
MALRMAPAKTAWRDCGRNHLASLSPVPSPQSNTMFTTPQLHTVVRDTGVLNLHMCFIHLGIKVKNSTGSGWILIHDIPKHPRDTNICSYSDFSPGGSVEQSYSDVQFFTTSQMLPAFHYIQKRN